MIRVCKNMLVPINKIPPEILVLIPDFWDTRDRDKDVITLTHVCHAWREIFVSRSSLWTNFDCSDKEKTRVYFERSKSSPINLSLDLSKGIPSHDSFFQIIPHATGRLKSLFVKGLTGYVEVFTSHLSHPAPLLECLSIHSDSPLGYRAPVLPPALFNGDLSSLRMLCLESVHTELPWRNMINLTSLALTHIPSGAVSAGRLLDFFESAPYLEEVKLWSATPKAGIQGGRLVSLACLKSMDIIADTPCSALLNHLLIPAGAKLEIRTDRLSSSPIEEHLPRSLDNLKNFSDFTAIELYPDKYYQGMKFSGPNGRVNITLRNNRRAELMSEFLAKLDTSKTKRLIIDHGYLLSRESLYRALLPMKDLRTLALSKCNFTYTPIRALEPCSSEVMVCPKLEELVLMPHPRETMSRIIVGVTEMAAARASRGEKLRTFRIVGGLDAVDFDMSELGKYVCNVEYGPIV